jgi:8-oxo-dGTP pyrophosphatase MutT (NUDIX family)
MRWRHEPSRYSPLFISGSVAGRIPRSLEDRLTRIAAGLIERHGEVWRIVCEGKKNVSRSLDVVSARLAEEGLIPRLRGERYWVRSLADGAKLGTIDRSAAVLFGFRTQGVHLNVYTQGCNGGIDMWLARRKLTRHHFPGELDNLVAGGLPAVNSIRETLRREAEEEAGIDESTLASARPAGRLSYCMDTKEGLVDGEMEVFDLEISASFRPENRDGSVDRFLLVSPLEAEHLALRDDAFKFNCGLVVFDFLLRHGALPGLAEDAETVSLLRTNRAWLASAELECWPGGR